MAHLSMRLSRWAALCRRHCAGSTAVARFAWAIPWVVQGAGPVGLSAILLAKLSGAREIIAVDMHENRLAIARSLGATATVSLKDSPEERRRQIYDRVAPNGPDIVVEAAGALPAFPEGVDIAGNHGRYIILGLWVRSARSRFPRAI